MKEKLAIDGGTPVRNIKAKPWPTWPCVSEQDWQDRVEPALKEVYLSGVEGLPGPHARKFAARYGRYCGTKFARMVVHGTDAIGGALAASLDLDVFSDGGEVILPNYTFIATASAPLDRRCSLAFVDIDPQTFTLDPVALEQAIVPGRTRAVVPVHLAGHPANMAAIMAIARKHDLVVVEDCAQAHGAKCDGKHVGSIGHAGAFSFQSSKNLTSGEGGLVTTDDELIDARVWGFMDVGRDPRGAQWEYPRLGWNYRPSEYLATLLSLRLEDLESQTEHRNQMASHLSARLTEVPGVTPPFQADWCTRHAYHLYCLLIDPEQFGRRSADEVVEALRAEGVPCTRGYTSPLARTPALKQIRETYSDVIREAACPNTKDVCRRSIWLTQPMLLASQKDMDDIAESIAKVQRCLNAA